MQYTKTDPNACKSHKADKLAVLGGERDLPHFCTILPSLPKTLQKNKLSTREKYTVTTPAHLTKFTYTRQNINEIIL